MPFSDLLVTEIFYSLQGEGSHAGLPYIFIRLTGCNLRCTYCDSAYAFKGGTRMRISEVIEKVKTYPTKNVLVTGGEPLIQRQTPELIRALKNENYQVSIETHGEISIESVSPLARIIMDIKTPSSGMCRMGFIQNLNYLNYNAEVKFVIASQEDYTWAKEILKQHPMPTKEILFSSASQAPNQPGSFTGVSPTWLADQILKDSLPVRFQIQLHKFLWGNARGV